MINVLKINCGLFYLPKEKGTYLPEEKGKDRDVIFSH